MNDCMDKNGHITSWNKQHNISLGVIQRILNQVESGNAVFKNFLQPFLKIAFYFFLSEEETLLYYIIKIPSRWSCVSLSNNCLLKSSQNYIWQESRQFGLDTEGKQYSPDLHWIRK